MPPLIAYAITTFSCNKWLSLFLAVILVVRESSLVTGYLFMKQCSYRSARIVIPIPIRSGLSENASLCSKIVKTMTASVQTSARP